MPLAGAGGGKKAEIEAYHRHRTEATHGRAVHGRHHHVVRGLRRKRIDKVSMATA